MEIKQIDIDKMTESILSALVKSKKLLEHEIDSNYDDSEILSFFSKIITESLHSNSAIAERVADYLQLFKNRKYFESVSLEEIKSIYEILIEINPFDITYYESLGWYLHNVYDLEDEAKEVVKRGIDIIQSKVDTLKSQFYLTSDQKLN